MKPGTVDNWSVGGVSNPGRDDGTFDSGIAPHSGNFDFYGGNGAAGTLTQTVDLIGAGISAAAIDSGSAIANLEFFEQSLAQGTSDAASMQLRFADSSHATVGAVYDSGLVANPDGWFDFTGAVAVPAQTRSVDVTMTFTLRSGSDLDSFIDDASLTIAVPEPASAGAVLLLAGTGLMRRRWHRRR